MESQLRDRISAWDGICSITGSPGLSVGIIHQGQVIFRHNCGVLDVQMGQIPDSDSLYCIASLSKAFMAASIDLLVREKKVSWDSTVESVIPEFKHCQKPEIYSTMTLRDICSHRTDLLGLDEITQGLDGRILIPKKDIVKVCNALPIKHDLRTSFLYNNGLYELAGHVVERLSGCSTRGDFQRDRIFKPLGMDRTTAFRDVHEMDDNIAKGYMILTDGAPSYIKPTELSANSMNGSSGGIRSSVNDLLKWCSCLLHSFREDTEADGLVCHASPIFERATIANPLSAEDGDYGTGWCYHRTPGKLGLISPNRELESPTLGASSPSLLVYGHQGDVPGYSANLYIAPDSNSAIVVLSNATGRSNTTDWIAQDILQTMFDLQPAIDFREVASRASTKYISLYDKAFKIPLEENQVCGTPLPYLGAFVGTYVMDDLDVVRLDVVVDQKDPSKLQMMINEQHGQVWQMWHYNFDVFCHLPDRYNQFLSRGLLRTLWSSFLISFTRDASGSGAVTGCCWKLDGVDVFFSRT